MDQITTQSNPSRQGRDVARGQKPMASNRTKTWASASRMASAKSQINERRQKLAQAAQDKYTGSITPVPGHVVFESRLILPGKHLLPRELEDRTSLHDICTAHRVWITYIRANIFQIQSHSMTDLQEALESIHSRIRDLRLSDECLATRFFVQTPTKELSTTEPINVQLGSRPNALPNLVHPKQISSALDSCAQQLYANLQLSTESLRAVGAELRMRVNFGHLKIRQIRKGLKAQLSYKSFAEVMRVCSVRGGACLETRLADIDFAEILVQSLMGPAGIYTGVEDVKVTHTVSLVVDEGELVANTVILPDTNPQLSTVRMVVTGAWPRLDWITSAPDMKLDWNIRVDSLEVTGNVPENLQELFAAISLEFEETQSRQLLASPRLSIKPSRSKQDFSVVKESRLRTSAIIPFKNSSHAVEISVMHTWKNCQTSLEPETNWGIEFYGVHWDEAINRVSGAERRKDWGEDAINIWPGASPRLEERFREFLQEVLELHSALDQMVT